MVQCRYFETICHNHQGGHRKMSLRIYRDNQEDTRYRKTLPVYYLQVVTTQIYLQSR